MAAKGKKKGAGSKSSKGKHPEEKPPVVEEEEESTDDSDDESSVYDSGDDGVYPDDDGDYESEEDDSGSDDSEYDEEEDDEGFEEQGSSVEDEVVVLRRQAAAVDRRSRRVKTGKKKGAVNNGNDDDYDSDDASEDDDDGLEVLDGEGLGRAYEDAPRTWRNSAASKTKRTAGGRSKKSSSSNDGDGTKNDNKDESTSQWMHTDDLSSDDEDPDGTGNRIGRVPLHWYEEYDHIGYDAHGGKVIKQSGGSGGGDMLDEAIRQSDDAASGKFVVHDALNARDVELTPRQIELIRRIQSGELLDTCTYCGICIAFELAFSYLYMYIDLQSNHHVFPYNSPRFI